LLNTSTKDKKEMALNFNPEGKKVLLSIDGGGMRGVISLSILAELEEMTGKPAYELFDMVGGTSTGAIIATGLGLRMTAKEILYEVYKTRLPQAFGPRDFGFWLRFIFVNRLRFMYPLEPFVDVLLPYSKGKKMTDFTQPIVYMTTKDVRTGGTYYIVSAGPGAPFFSNYTISGAVAASGAAPIFFPPVLGNLVDGGVGSYGNPCLGAAIEAVEYIGFPEDNLLHISLGTGYAPWWTTDGAAATFGLQRWMTYLIVKSVDDAAIQQTQLTRRLYKKTDFRRYNPLLTPESISDPTKLGINLTGRPNPYHLTLDSSAPAELDLMEEIGRKYARKIDWHMPNLLPWDAAQVAIGGHELPKLLPTDWTGSIFQ
jgi:uncharacterized protein